MSASAGSDASNRGGGNRSRKQSAAQANAVRFNKAAEAIVRDIKPVDFTRGDFPVIYMIAPPRSGKTTCLFSILRDLAGSARLRPETAYVVCGSEDVRQELRKVIPGSLVRKDFDEAKLGKVFGQADYVYKNFGRSSPQVVVLDDVTHDFDEILKSNVMQELHNNHRHLGMTTLVTSQYVKKVPKGIRGAIDYLVVFGNCTGEFIDMLFDCWFKGCFENKHVFKRVFRAITNRNGGKTALVFNTRASAASGEMLGWYYPDYGCNPEPRQKPQEQAPFVPFRVCGRMVWMADEMARAARAKKEAQRGAPQDSLASLAQRLRSTGKSLAPSSDTFETY